MCKFEPLMTSKTLLKYLPHDYCLCKSSALHEHELNYSMTVAPYCFMPKESKMNK